MADRTSLSEDEGTLTRSEVRKERETCERCGARKVPQVTTRTLEPKTVLVCGSLAKYGYHRDRAE